MSDFLFFDSLAHASYKGNWLGRNHFDASLARLLAEVERVKPYRACLVNIAGYSDNEELAAIAAKHRNLFVPIAGFDPTQHSDSKLLNNGLGELRDCGFAGIKLHPRLNGYDPLDERCLTAIQRASAFGLVVFVDTLFRQHRLAVNHPSDIIDRIAHACPDTQIVLLHGAASAMLDVYEIVRMRKNLLLDTSFTLMRYAGSSLDDDLRFVFRTLDERVVTGSDFPEYSLLETRDRISTLLSNLPSKKVENILSQNMLRFLGTWMERYAE